MRRRRIDEIAYRLPEPTQPQPLPGSFVCVPLSCLPGLSPEQREAQAFLYQLALKEAEAVARPSLPERDLLGVWN